MKEGKLEIRLLGPVTIAVDGETIDERLWTRRKAKSLVKILALSPRHQLGREQLMELLWPELDPDLSSNNLNKVIHAARRVLEPDLKSGTESCFIATQEQHVALKAPGGVHIDAEEFEARATHALRGDAVLECDRAIELYAGDLLDEDRYEPWAEARREQLKRLYERLLAHAGQLDEAQGRIEESLDHWRKLLAADPANEDAHRQLMRLYARTGSRHQALQQFEQCKDVIRRELDAEPEPATLDLYKQILSGKVEAQSAVRVQAEVPLTLSDTDSNSRPRRRVWIAAALGLLAVLAAGFLYFKREQTQQKIEAIAVLPFANDTGDANLDYLTDGITESLINSLSHLSQTRVVARTTSFRYRGAEADPAKVGQQLNVQAIVTGRVEQRGDDLIIQADLVDVPGGSQLWGDKYNRKLSDILAIQSQIAREITDRLRLRLTSEEQTLLAKQHTENVDAYRHYLRGRFYWNKRTSDSVRKAVEHYDLAIAADPAYALAFAGIADAYAVWPDDSLSRRETARKVKEAALKALSLDERLAEAHTSLAFARMIEDRDLAGAESSFKRSIELNPNYPTAHHWYAYDLVAQGRIDDALTSIRRAQELDPVSLSINGDVGEFYFFARKYDEAAAQCRKTLELDSGFIPAHQNLGLALAHDGRKDEAIKELTNAVELSNRNTYVTALLGYVLALAGRQSDARAIIEELRSASKARYVSPFHLALVHARLGEFDRAFELLEQANSERVFSMLLVKVDPRLDHLRNDPRFQTLLNLATNPQKKV